MSDSGLGFASGFAQGFANTFVAIKQQEAKEDADIVRFNMTNYANQKAKYNAAVTEDNKKRDTAKSQVEAYGLPEDAWKNIYVDLNGGLTLGQVQTKIANGSYTPAKKAQNETPEIAPAVEAVDMQTEALLSGQDLTVTSNAAGTEADARVDTPSQNLFQRMGNSLATAFDKDKRRQKREDQVMEKTLQKLNITEDEYRTILGGYQSDLPELSLVYSAKKDPSKVPNWKQLSKVTKDNYLSYAAEARANGDEEQAVAIESLGESINSLNPKYADFSTMTDENAAGRLLAATSAGDTETASAIETWMEDNVDPDKGPKYKDYASMTTSNARGRLVAARKAGDDESIRTITDYLMEKDDAFPDKIDKEWIVSQYSKFSIAASKEGATAEDRLAFQNFKELELPAYLEAYKLLNPDEPLDFESAWDEYYRIKNDPASSPDDIADALGRANNALYGQQIVEELKTGAGKPVSLVKPGADGTADVVNDVTVTYTADGPKYTNSAGDELVGYRRITNDEDGAREKAVTAVRSEIVKYNGNLATATSAVRLTGEITGMVVQDDRVLLNSSRLATGLSGAVKEATNILGITSALFGANANENDLVQKTDLEQQLQAKGVLGQGETLEDLAATNVATLPDSVEGLARRKAAFDAKIILMAFRAGGLEGQTGMAMSNKDFERLREVVQSSKDGKTFIENLRTYVQGRIDGVQDQAGIINNNEQITSFNGRYGYTPLFGEDTVVAWDDIVNNPPDERFQKGMDIINGNYQLPDAPEATKSLTPEIKFKRLADNQRIEIDNAFLDAYPQFLQVLSDDEKSRYENGESISIIVGNN